MKKNQVTWWHFAAAIVICLLIGVAGSLRAQNYEQADSIGVIFQDSTVQLYFEWRNEIGGVNAIYTEPLDSATAANFAFNVAVQANNTTFQALQLLGQSGRIRRFTRDASDVLQALEGRTYRQKSEAQFINNLSPACDSTGVCTGFYTFKQTGQAGRILRIRNSGAVREVNANGNNTSGGLQGTVRFLAGTNLFEIVFSAGPLNGQTIQLYNIPSNRNRQRWASIEADGDRLFLLVERKNLGDTQATALGK